MCKTNLNLLPLNSGCFCSTSLSLSAGSFLCSLFECQMLKYLLNKFWLWFGKINVLQRVEGGEKGCPLLNFCMFWEITGPRCLMKKSWELPNVLRATGFTVHGSAGVYVNFQSSRCLNPAARNLKEIRVVRGSLSALAVIPYLFVVDPSEGGSGILFVQNMLGERDKGCHGRVGGCRSSPLVLLLKPMVLLWLLVSCFPWGWGSWTSFSYITAQESCLQWTCP